ncbi:Bestrophin, RFP-TM, chloride channel-domain-containing protein [Mycena leptocephala]|nr:Bestrophin, RFP-TM, chloride channel-domain-containing protein [Mycena leptocephala]
MNAHKVHNKRSFTGNHSLLPAMGREPPPFIPKVPTYAFLKWSFGRGSVIWKIWPAVLLHTLFAAAIVYISKATEMTNIPNVMLTVMGVVIGFVISYRAMTGYDRYWMGRTAWADVIRNARTTARLIWYHVPVRLTPGANVTRSPQELAKVMAEKRMALDLVEAFAVSLKHHLRGEVGIYYEDLYDLVRPLHDVRPFILYASPFTDPSNPRPTVASAVPSPPVAPIPSAPPASTNDASGSSSGVSTSSGTSASSATLKVNAHAAKRPNLSTSTSSSTDNSISAVTTANLNPSQTSIHRTLLPASNPAPEDGVLRRVAPDVIPFAGVFAGVGRWVRGFWKQHKVCFGCPFRDRSSRIRIRTWSGPIHPQGVAQLEEYEKGENLPEEVLRCLTEWISVLEERGTVPGTSLGNLLAGIQAFEISLTTLEHILTTPLPLYVLRFLSSVVWLYLFLLPFQLVNDFDWHTVPAVCVGAFVYLGFVAAGEEIEQPFGYDDNDLDLDMFCRDIIRRDIRCLKKARCLNAWFPPRLSRRLWALGPMAPRPMVTVTHANGEWGRLAPGTGIHAYGGNMYRASLASLSDSASLISEEDEEEDEDTEQRRRRMLGPGGERRE